MEKTNCLLDAVKNQLQNAISNIDAGNSNLNEEEMEELVKTLSVLNKGAKRISKAYACEHILHCSPATFDNYVRAGNVEIKIPFINKAIALDKDDINEFKEMLSKIQQ